MSNHWHDPMAGYREQQRAKKAKEDRERYQRFVRERILYWSLLFLGLGAFALWAV